MWIEQSDSVKISIEELGEQTMREVKIAKTSALEEEAKLRRWIKKFNIGKIKIM